MTPALIVPYRNREQHLKRFLSHYKAFPIYIIEQDNDRPFNRGLLLNAGFKVFNDYHTHFIFHDVDMICVNGLHHYYSYPGGPSQLATHAEQFRYRMPFPEYFGGVTMFSREDFIECDGFSNNFNGWGGEDCEMYDNVTKKHGFIIHYKNCWHKSLPHERPTDSFILPRDHPNYKLWRQGRVEQDGLSHLEFTWTLKKDGHILVDW